MCIQIPSRVSWIRAAIVDLPARDGPLSTTIVPNMRSDATSQAVSRCRQAQQPRQVPVRSLRTSAPPPDATIDGSGSPRAHRTREQDRGAGKVERSGERRVVSAFRG